jgi:hypothetical protein
MSCVKNWEKCEFILNVTARGLSTFSLIHRKRSCSVIFVFLKRENLLAFIELSEMEEEKQPTSADSYDSVSLETKKFWQELVK